jgi:pyruvate dehydrogenase E2 component (dihydrolipoamide acetyltransferase)
MRVDAAAALALRAQLGHTVETVPTFNDILIAAAGRALAEHPRLNASYVAGEIEFHDRCNVGLAVSVEDELVVPVLADADTKTLPEIATETSALVVRARAGSLTPSDLEGGTFTVSNLGMFGVLDFDPIINPPQAAILGVGAHQPGADPSVEELTVTLVSDHRIVYGTHAARFLADLRALIETPARLLTH